MKIGFHLPSNFAFSGRSNGIRIQAVAQANALEKLGHEVYRLSPWAQVEVPELDLVHFFVGGLSHEGIESYKPDPIRRMVFAPIIDHDEDFWMFSESNNAQGSQEDRLKVRKAFTEQCHASELIVVRSAYEKKRIIEVMGINAAKIAVVLNGIEPPNPKTDADRVRGRYRLPDRFIFHLSAYCHPRKNVLKLIQAVGPTGIPLVIAGSTFQCPLLEKIRLAAAAYPTITLLNYVSDQERCDLMAASKVFALPSLVEGTGLAALEAVTYDNRVVITPHGGTRDYFGDLAYYVQPEDVEDIRRGILMAWDQADSTVLRSHVETQLSWSRSAYQLVHAYQEMLQR